VTQATERVLLVDDDEAVRTVLAAQLEQAGIVCVQAANAARALELLGSGAVDVMVTDLRMPGMDGLELLGRATKLWADVPVIVLTAFGSVRVAVEAMKLGAVDFLVKPFDRKEVVEVVTRALRVARECNGAPPSVADVALVGVLGPLRDSIRRAAAASATVLVHGENGTGKELVARAIHEASPRAREPFIAVNCAALPEALIESELFGYEKGAFTGANKVKPGRVELAHKGTLFLDEIGEYPLSTQVKLLRLLETRKLERLGGTETIDVDVRFIAATNKELEPAVERGEFREDLYFRLAIPIRVPPLRERPTDIEPLITHFVTRSAAANGRPRLALSRDALTALAEQPWPGNVRQLENFAERLVVFTDGECVERSDVERELARDRIRAGTTDPPSTNLARTKRDAERAAIIVALERAGNVRARAARLLGLSRRSLYTKLAEHELLEWRPGSA
jgi:two-component system, NtrC family, response regulator AtoC